MWWIVATASVALIALGLGLLIREGLSDGLKSRSVAAQQRASDRSEKNAGQSQETTAGSPPSGAANANLAPSVERLQAIVAGAETETAHSVPAASRAPAVESQWPHLKPEIEQAVASINRLMQPVALSIAGSGASTWSLHNRGFGDYRRILIDGRSIAWLRMELSSDAGLAFKLRSHEAADAGLNRTSFATAPFSATRLANTLAECLAPAAEYSATRRTGRAAATPMVASVASVAPNPVPRLLDEALILVNGAFQEVDARLIPARAPQRREPIGAADRALSIDVAGGAVGLMLIEPRTGQIDISVGVADLANFAAARRDVLLLHSLTAHSLAEKIATCAWPAIAAARARVSAA